MALPIIDPLETEFDMPNSRGGRGGKAVDDNVKEEIIKLGQAITDKTKSGLETATKMVIGNVPNMIADLTKEIESGPVNNFAVAMNKLIALVDKLGINLNQYNEGLAKTVDEFVGTQEKLSQKISDLNEQGIKAVIDESGKSIKILTEQEVQSKIIERSSKIEEVKELKEKITKAFKEATLNPDIKKQQDKLITTNTELIKLREQEIEQLDKTVGPQLTAGRDDSGFGKLAELKDAFMIIPDTITEVFDTFKAVGTKVFSGFAKLFDEPGKALKEMGKNLTAVGGVFKTARILLALKIAAVVLAIQFFAERIDKIGDFFVGIWDKITGFFQGIVDWFKNSAVGKFFFGGDDKEKQDKVEDKGAGQAGDMRGETYMEDDNQFKAPVRDMRSATIEDGLENQTITEMGDYDDNSQKFLNQRQMADIDGLGTEEIDYTGVRGGTSLGQLGIKKRSVVGNQLQGDTSMQGGVSESLKELNAENAASPSNVINIQNNSNVNSQSSSGTTVSGFVDHEPDTSFKIVRQSAVGSLEF
jgi:hypothetical protein